MFPPCLVPFPRALPTPSKPVSPVLPLCPHQLPVLPLPPSPSPPCPCSGKVLESFELRSESPRTETIAQRWSPAERGGPGAAIGASCRFTSVFPSALDAVTRQGWEAGLCCALLPAEGLGGFVPHLFPLLRLCVRVSHGSPGTERRSPESLGKGLSLPISCPWSSGQCSPL